MTFKVSPNETIQKCDYTNPFRTHVEENRLRDARVNIAKERDIQVSAADKKEREIIERYLKGYFNQEDLQLSALQIVGKMVFFLIVMPPVFILFTAPKWLLTEILQKGEDLLQNVQNKLITWGRPVIDWSLFQWNLALQKMGMRGKQITELFAKGKHLLSKVVERSLDRLKMISSPLIDGGRIALNAIALRLSALGDKGAELLQKIASFRDLLPKRASAKSSTEMLKPVTSLIQESGKKIALLAKAMVEDAKEVAEGAKFLLGMGAGAIVATTESVRALVLPLVMPFQKGYESARGGISLAQATLKAALFAAQNYAARFQGFVVLKYENAGALLSNFFVPLRNRFQNLFKTIAERALLQLGHFQKEVKRMGSLLLAPFKRAQKWLRSLLDEERQEANKHLTNLEKWFKRRNRPALMKLGASLKKKKSRLSEMLAMVKESVLSFFKQFFLGFSALFLIFRVFLKVAFQRI